ncbi:MAG: type II toxin-antitoxin system prevent-host-death family antitoxin [Propionibacteriaceae bacterium]|nr:type II toxin-antitoxin system prevent-host-death family antitoxin [Propionibacteriaceae bacterium]
MSTVINVQEAKTHLSALIARAEAGEDIVIARSGRPILRLVPIQDPPPREFGHMAFSVPDDFDAALDDDELATWE